MGSEPGSSPALALLTVAVVALMLVGCAPVGHHDRQAARAIQSRTPAVRVAVAPVANFSGVDLAARPPTIGATVGALRFARLLGDDESPVDVLALVRREAERQLAQAGLLVIQSALVDAALARAPQAERTALRQATGATLLVSLAVVTWDERGLFEDSAVTADLVAVASDTNTGVVRWRARTGPVELRVAPGAYFWAQVLAAQGLSTLSDRTFTDDVCLLGPHYPALAGALVRAGLADFASFEDAGAPSSATAEPATTPAARPRDAAPEDTTPTASAQDAGTAAAVAATSGGSR